MASLANSVPLSTVIYFGAHAADDDLIQCSRHLLAAQSRIGVQCQALAGILINHSQHPNPPTVSQSLRDEIHTPLFVSVHGPHLRQTLSLSTFLAAFRSHDRPFFGVETMRLAFTSQPSRFSITVNLR
jgi:hypothetical protein